MTYPNPALGTLYAPAQVDEYLSILFRNVDWSDGQLVSVLGIGEKGTPQEGTFRERQIIPPTFMHVGHKHLKRWSESHVAGFIVPAVLKAAALDKGDVTLDKVAALTAIILDIDTGDTAATRTFVTSALGTPSMVVASGGVTAEGTPKLHCYWLLNEPSDEVERVAAIRKRLAAKVGGDQSFGRATQVIRIPGTVHAKNGKASLCSILARSDCEYSLDDLADTIEAMQPMPGLPEPKQSQLPALVSGGMMDFTPRQDTATAALCRDVNEGGQELTRWGEFSKVAGLKINEVRAGRLTMEQAYSDVGGWVLAHMNPPWPDDRVEAEFRSLINVDQRRHGPFPQALPPVGPSAPRALRLEYFADIEPSMTNNYIVRDWLMSASLALIFGSPSAGKSFFAIDWGLKIAAGAEVNGRAVKQCPVVYVGAEGKSGLRRRIAAARAHYELPPSTPFVLVPETVNLLDPLADLPLLFAAIQAAAERFGATPGLIILDTLAATYGGGDENSGTDMGIYISHMAKIMDHFGATVCAVHHRPKDRENATPRGSGRLMGDLDTIISIEADANGHRVATLTKQKDGEDGLQLHFGLRSIELGADDEGCPVTSCVVEYRDAKVGRSKLSPQAEAVLAALIAVSESAGGMPVAEGLVRARWVDSLPAGMKEDTERKRWNRAKIALSQAGLIKDEAGCWSILASAVEGASVMNFAQIALAA